MSLIELKKNFVNEIKKSKQFAELKNAMLEIEKYPDIKNKIDSFKKKRLNLMNSKMQIAQKEFEATKLEKEFMNLSQIPEIKKLMTAEKKYNEFLFNLYKSINIALDSELKRS
ncbi:YlbF family regulator [Clostridiaceae bacterium M8S5]|nr:YlbF family regulator [Clostridiaceae bacterium M8S5]